MGRKRDYEEGIGPGYRFTEEQKDIWANLFEYRGSEEHVRLRFSIDTLGMGLDDIVITYGEDRDLTDDTAWQAFIASLHREANQTPEPTYPVREEPEAPAPLQRS